MNKLYHPISGEIIDFYDLDDSSAFIEDRLFKPKSWDVFYFNEADKDNLTYGIEIELNTSSSSSKDRIEVCKQLLKVLNKEGRHFHIMRDNSVRNGIELVSAPMTYKYWIETFNVKEINDLFTQLKLSATIDTGLHIHVGIEHTRRIRELYVQLFSISYPFWVHLSDRRVLRIQERYVSTEYFYRKPELKSRYIKTIESLIKHGHSKVSYEDVEYYDYQFDDRYTGLNFFNDKTIEFRMFSGTDNFFDIIDYLTLVDVIAKLADEISRKRVNDVFDLDTFVKRTGSDLILSDTVRYLRFVNAKENKERIYENHFLFLDSHWYQLPLSHVKRKDFAIDKQVYMEYLGLRDQLKENIRYPQSMNLENDINNILINNLLEVTRTNGDIYLVGLRGDTSPHIIKESDVKNFIFLRGVNSALIKESLK